METWRAVQNDDNSVTEYEVHSNLNDIVPVWKELYQAEKQRILELMVEKVIVNYEYADVRIRADGMLSLAR